MTTKNEFVIPPNCAMMAKINVTTLKGITIEQNKRVTTDEELAKELQKVILNHQFHVRELA